MKDKFYNPFIIWFGIWLFICLVMSLITIQINRLHRQSDLERKRSLTYCRPYEPFSPRFGIYPDPWERHPFSSDYRQPLIPEPEISPISPLPVPGGADWRWKDFSFLSPDSPSSPDSLWTQRLLLREQGSATDAGYYYTVISYLLFVVGFGAICLITAIYQNYFRQAQEKQFETEIEARNLRIQMLESSRTALDLKLQLLDQDHGRALAAAQEAQENIRQLEENLQSEADRNDELQGDLLKALQEENNVLKMLRTLDRDRRKIVAEKMNIAFRLAEAETPQDEDRYRQKIRKARGRLRLNAIWLSSLYQNLSFSPRALQNIGELQEVSEVFPSLPDALAKINRLSLEGLLSGEKLPPKSVARFTTQDLEHFQGPFWEYRFSSDGRIFFGISQSRTWNIDTILLKRRFPDKKEKYDRYLAATLGKDNQDLQTELIS